MSVEAIRWFIGYDRREIVAYHVLAHSILEHASVPVAIVPVALHQLGGLFDRPRDPLQSTDFAFSRFLVPYLAGGGHAIFSDCDMLCRADPAELWRLRDEDLALQVVQHDHQPTETAKFLGQTQSAYPRKNWSSLMLINCTVMRSLWTPDRVATASGLELHRFAGVPDWSIGALPARWNHLVGVDAPRDDAALVHWTLGGPWFRGFEGVEYADEWWQTYRRMTSSADAPDGLQPTEPIPEG